MDSSLSSRRYSFKQFENLTLDIYSFLIEQSGSSTAMFTQIPFIIWLFNLIATRGHHINRFQKLTLCGVIATVELPRTMSMSHCGVGLFVQKSTQYIFKKPFMVCQWRCSARCFELSMRISARNRNRF